jgi:membrane protease subunit HflC
MGVVAVVLIVVIFSAAYIVDETEQVVVTQFGKVMGEPITEPGLKFKIPVIQMANYFPKNLQEWDGDPGQIPTLDKTYIWVDIFARWKIVNPVRFLESVATVQNALGRLDDIIDPAVRNLVTSNSLIETVRKTDRKMDTFEVGITEDETEQDKLETKYKIKLGREKITRAIMEQAQPKLKNFGIELIDVKIKRINYVEQVRLSVYDRMIAERNQIAEKFRSEGKGEAQKIRGEKEKDLKLINSEAYRKAQIIKGEADADATRIYASAYGIDPEFYSFIRTLEVYGETMDEDSTLILSTDSEFLKYFKSLR